MEPWRAVDPQNGGVEARNGATTVEKHRNAIMTVGGPCYWSLSISCPDAQNVLVLILIRRSALLNHKTGSGPCSFLKRLK
jgi:hypothetical protein